MTRKLLVGSFCAVATLLLGGCDGGGDGGGRIKPLSGLSPNSQQGSRPGPGGGGNGGSVAGAQNSQTTTGK